MASGREIAKERKNRLWHPTMRNGGPASHGQRPRSSGVPPSLRKIAEIIRTLAWQVAARPAAAATMPAESAVLRRKRRPKTRRYRTIERIDPGQAGPATRSPGVAHLRGSLPETRNAKRPVAMNSDIAGRTA